MRVSRATPEVSPQVARRLVYLRSSVDGSLLRIASLNGISYLVVPCVSKLGDNVEWPINAPYPELIPAEVLAFAAHMRNNRPVVMGHPHDEAGEYVSANTPEILASYAFGHVFNARFDAESNKMLCDLWLDPARAQAVGPDAESVIARLQAGQMVEVSEGDYVAVDETPGVWIDGRKYGAKWVLCFPDHVATLREDEIGACSIEDGCGALRASQGFGPVPSLRVATGIRVSVLSQARRPSYSGTETSTWTRPTFADYIRYLYNGDLAPGSVSQCSMDLKRAIAGHTLLGDPEASNFGDLSAVPVVNPATGYLNESALRAVLAGRGLSGLSDSAVNSAQEMARRLLNSEFSANLEAAATSQRAVEGEATMADSSQKANSPGVDSRAGLAPSSSPIRRFFASMAESFRAAMSNNELRQKLYKALKPLEPGLSYVYDEDVETGLVRYVVAIYYGDSYRGEYEYKFYTRSFEINGTKVAINDDPVQVEWYEGWRPVSENQDSASNPVGGRVSTATAPITVSTADPVTTLASGSCGCQNTTNFETLDTQGGETMSMSVNLPATVNRAAIVARLSALPQLAHMAESLNSMSDQNLEVLDRAFPAPATVPTAFPAAPAISTASAAPVETPTNTPEAQQTVSVPREEYAQILAASNAFEAQQQARKAALVTSLSAAQTAFTAPDLQAMDILVLEKMVQAFKVDQPQTPHTSYVALPVNSGSNRPALRELPDPLGLRAHGLHPDGRPVEKAN